MHVNTVHEENERLSKRKSKLGIRLFFIYLICYTGFILIGVFEYELLRFELFGGINLALAYGIGLIVFAIIMGIIYNYLCSKYEDEDAQLAEQERSNT